MAIEKRNKQIESPEKSSYVRPATTDPLREVPAQQAELSKVLAALHERITMLENVLAPVLTQELVDSNGDIPAEPALCGLADALRGNVHEVSSAIARIDDLIKHQQVS